MPGKISHIEEKLGGMSIDAKELNDLLRRIDGKRPKGLPNGVSDEGGPDNDIRAAWAAIALHVFARTSGLSVEDELDDVVRDLLTDLAHFADRAGMDLPPMLAWSGRRYQEETRDKGKQLGSEEPYPSFAGKIQRCIAAEIQCARQDKTDQNDAALSRHEGAVAAFRCVLRVLAGKVPDADLDKPLAEEPLNLS